VNAAIEVELLKARRAPVFRWGALTLIVGVPALTAIFFVLAQAGGGSTAAAKATALVTDLSLAGYLGMIGQVLSVALLLSAGVVISWTYGREFVDDAAPALFAIATPRGQVAAAKLAVVLVWAATTVALTVAVGMGVGLALGLDPTRAAAASAGRCLVGGVLVAALTVPFGWIASWRRGYLPGFVALLGAVVVTQVVTATGAGGWFPYAAPSLWLGLGGEAAADDITVGQLLLPLLVGAIGGVLTVQWWQRAQAV